MENNNSKSNILRSLIIKPYLICPTCGSDDVMKNGMTRRGKQNHKCRDCGRQESRKPEVGKPRTWTRHLGKNWALLIQGMNQLFSEVTKLTRLGL
ncbi:hypothetical protein QUB05_22390 [Microcoleus sp. F10-C6]